MRSLTSSAGELPPDDAGPADLSRLALRGAGSKAELSAFAEHLCRAPQVRSMAAQLARSLSDHSADDLLQWTLERVVRGIASYRGSGDVLGWVGRIMRNAHIELARREVSDRRKSREHALDDAAAHTTDPADLLHERRRRACVLEAWRRTSDDPEVRLFWERVYVGLSVDQLVRATGHPRSTVYVMLKRGGGKLLHEFERVLREQAKSAR
jgi:RNA polymerase sigma factor (sigma-70 family)